MKALWGIFIGIVVWGSVNGQNKEPAWVFPIYFEEGTGQRDTLYLCYDSTAISGALEPQFGETFVQVDSGVFSASFRIIRGDSALKKEVVPNLFGSFGSIKSEAGSFSFVNGILPVKVKWDVQLFYSDSLPFSDQDPLPRAQGVLFIDGGMISQDLPQCDFTAPVFMTDTVIALGLGCVRQDSVILVDLFGASNRRIQYMLLHIEKWRGTLFNGINENENEELVRVYPNPFTNTTTIQSDQPISSYRIYSISGRLVREQENLSGNTITIDRGNLPSGMYFIEVLSREGVLSREKVIVQ